jgi:hypothetical protein
MIVTLGLSMVYFKLLSIGTYIPMVYLNYKFPFLDKVIEYDMYKNYEKKLISKYPKISKSIQIISYTINKSAEFMTKITIKQIQTWSNVDLCARRLSKAIIHTTLSYKLLFPVYAYVSYSLAKKHVK